MWHDFYLKALLGSADVVLHRGTVFWHGFYKNALKAENGLDGGVAHMKKFRVLFSLSNGTAEKFNTVVNKSEYVSLALEWYASFGIDSIKKIELILKQRTDKEKDLDGHALESISNALVNYEQVLQKTESVILKRLEHMESAILKELGFQGTESLKDRDAIKGEISRLSQKLRSYT